MDRPQRISVFPASGKLGTSIYTHLARLTEPKRLILISRNPKKVPHQLLDAGVTARQADYNEPESLNEVFDGASTLILISYPSIEIEHRFQAHRAAIDAARRGGVSHIFYASLAFGGDRAPTSLAHVMQAHILTENYLESLTRSSGTTPFSFTAIRQGIYSGSFPMYTGFPSLDQLTNSHPQETEVQIPHDGHGPGIAWAELDELGEASAKLVLERLKDGPRRNDIVLLSGSQAYAIEDTLKVLSDLTRKKIRLKKVSVGEYVEQPVVIAELGSHGPGNQVPQQWATSFEAIRAGECAVLSGELRRLLGREPEPFEATARRMLSQSD